jgi:hypothetical protein
MNSLSVRPQPAIVIASFCIASFCIVSSSHLPSVRANSLPAPQHRFQTDEHLAIPALADMPAPGSITVLQFALRVSGDGASLLDANSVDDAATLAAPDTVGPPSPDGHYMVRFDGDFGSFIGGHGPH